MAKWSCEELQVSEVLCESPNANVHAVVESLSPMKKSKTCSYSDVVHRDGTCIVSSIMRKA